MERVGLWSLFQIMRRRNSNQERGLHPRGQSNWNSGSIAFFFISIMPSPEGPPRQFQHPSYGRQFLPSASPDHATVLQRRRLPGGVERHAVDKGI